MVRLPWRQSTPDSAVEPADGQIDGEPIVSCSFQDGTLAVYESMVSISRRSASNFEDKQIAMSEITDITHTDRLVISYLQIDQQGFKTDKASLLSTPVDANTLHGGRGVSDCAKRAAEAIRDRMGQKA